MASLPLFLQVHTVTVTPKTGETGTGDVVGTPVSVAGFLDPKVRLVRNQYGQEVVSSATFYTTDTRDLWAPDSAVAWTGGSGVVISAATRTDAGLGAPQHTEVVIA